MGKQDIYIALKSKLLLRPRKYRVLDNFWIDSFLLFFWQSSVKSRLNSAALFSLPVIRMKGGEHLVEKSRTRESLHLSIYRSLSTRILSFHPLHISLLLDARTNYKIAYHRAHIILEILEILFSISDSTTTFVRSQRGYKPCASVWKTENRLVPSPPPLFKRVYTYVYTYIYGFYVWASFRECSPLVTRCKFEVKRK